MYENEQSILIQSILETMVPKLVGDDELLLKNIVSNIFPGISQNGADVNNLKQSIRQHAQSSHLVPTEEWEQVKKKLPQLQQVLQKKIRQLRLLAEASMNAL